MQTKLILFEGQPFTGKSTMSEYVAQQLELNGHAVDWVCEGDMLERYFPQVFALVDQAEPPSEETLWAEWSAFAQAVEHQPAISVVDAAVSYSAVLPLLDADRPVSDIEALVARLDELLAPLHPRVVYLRGDQASLARASIDDRGEAWEKQMIEQSDASPYQRARGRSGLDAAITYMEETQALLDDVLANAGWPLLTLDVTVEAREANRGPLLEFLGIPEVDVAPIALAEDLNAYAGTYVPDDPEDPRGPAEVRIESDQLVIFTRGQRWSPLIPVSPTRLHLRANPIDIEFEVEDGRAERLVLLWANGRTVAHHRT